MRVSNLRSPRSGATVANQYEIEHNGWDYFQSYQTLIAKKKGYNYVISMDYNYSRTTSKYFYEWLKDWGWTSEQYQDFRKWASKQIGSKSGQTLVLDNCTVKLVQELKK
jgi:hypothetical protein